MELNIDKAERYDLKSLSKPRNLEPVKTGMSGKCFLPLSYLHSPSQFHLS